MDNQHILLSEESIDDYLTFCFEFNGNEASNHYAKHTR